MTLLTIWNDAFDSGIAHRKASTYRTKRAQKKHRHTCTLRLGFEPKISAFSPPKTKLALHGAIQRNRIINLTHHDSTTEPLMKSEFNSAVSKRTKKRLLRNNVLVVYVADGKMQVFSSQSPPS